MLQGREEARRRRKTQAIPAAVGIGVALVALLLWMRPGRSVGRSRHATGAASPERPHPQDGVVAAEQSESVIGVRVLRGIVVDSGGAPLSGADIYVAARGALRMSDSTVRSVCVPARSGEAGRFAIRVKPEAEGALVCRKPGYVGASVALRAIDEDEIRFVLRRGLSIRGRVVTSALRPVSSAFVRARALSGFSQCDEAQEPWPGFDALNDTSCTTGADGTFELSGLSEGVSMWLEVFADGYALPESAHTNPKLTVLPPADVEDIVLCDVVCAVVGVRHGNVDCTLTAKHLTAWGASVRYSGGYRPAYSRVPLDRFSRSVTGRLVALARHRLVLLARRDRSGDDLPVVGTFNMREPGGSVVELRVPMHSIGAAGWDDTHWIDLDTGGHPRAGRVVAVCAGLRADEQYRKRPLRLFQEDARAPLIIGMEPGPVAGEFVAWVPPGKYRLRREGRDPPTYGLVVRPEESVRLEAEFRSWPVLSIDPRLPSGGPAREAAVYLRRARPGGGDSWLVNILEPFGCASGPERIDITPALIGKCEVIVGKRGFAPTVLAVELGAEDVFLAPTLRDAP